MSSSEQRSCRWEGKYLRVMQCGHWEYVERVGASGAVVIVALTADQKLIITEQYRVPMGHRVLELPAGLVGDEPGDSPEDLAEAARRELLEETGYAAREMIRLASGPPSAGLATEIVTFYLASHLEKKGPGGGVQSEDIVVHEIELAAAEDWLAERAADGVMVDPKIYVGLYFVQQKDTRRL